jgi:hypothetical protein
MMHSAATRRVGVEAAGGSETATWRTATWSTAGSACVVTNQPTWLPSSSGTLRRREGLAGSCGEHAGVSKPQPAAEEAAMLVAAQEPHRRARPSRPSPPPKQLVPWPRAER